MTSIRLSKSMDLGGGTRTYYVTIDVTGKITETLSRAEGLIQYPTYFLTFSKPTAAKPLRIIKDFLTIVRSFTIPGKISVECTDEIYDLNSGTHRAPKSAPEVRDLLNAMFLYGGTVFLQYGLPADYSGSSGSGYSAHADYMYYTNTGIECCFNRCMTDEPASGAAGTYRSGATIKQDTLSSGNPVQGTYKLPSSYEVTLELFAAVVG